MIACANVLSLGFTTDDHGGLAIAFRMNDKACARHALGALRTQLRETGRITIDFGMPVPVTGNDAVVNRS